ncbi:alpha-ribazole phosphatase family protein [Pseudomonas sp. OIL-1]|uniref:alpha-ribazole phosphatase family protein n=1 Tax=Pseudomonas sp. OIL-1 TaxID=2706126 RepID=UPI0013A77A8E|nr:alpha-ribazole phosphatase family protein [Pseudomonas sp. OIL-1]QIB49989.1 alpha-ribazole phosphatase family protein [Pseudomonas sp. OIL-1]
MIVDLLRHGETVSGGGFRGSLDDALTESGWEQMRQAVRENLDWDLIVTSPLQRCAKFAAELAQQRGVAWMIQPDLRELHFGEWEGRHPRDLMLDQAELLARFWDDPYAFTPPGAEPVSAFRQRVLAAMTNLQRMHAGRRILIISHAGVMRLLLARARSLPDRDLLQVEVSHGQLIRYAC